MPVDELYYMDQGGMNGHPANVKSLDTVVTALTFTGGFIDALTFISSAL